MHQLGGWPDQGLGVNADTGLARPRPRSGRDSHQEGKELREVQCQGTCTARPRMHWQLYL